MLVEVPKSTCTYIFTCIYVPAYPVCIYMYKVTKCTCIHEMIPGLGPRMLIEIINTYMTSPPSCRGLDLFTKYMSSIHIHAYTRPTFGVHVYIHV